MPDHLPFEHDTEFSVGVSAGTVRLGELESHYQELFAEALEDGVITSEERARLERAASSLGLDSTRIGQIEQALRAAYEATHQHKVYESKPSVAMSSAPSALSETALLQQRVFELEVRVMELEHDLEHARSRVALEVDLSYLRAPSQPLEDRTELLRRLRRDPRDVGALRTLYQIFGRQNQPDRQGLVAQVLSFLGEATDEEYATYEQQRPNVLLRPTRSLSQDDWHQLLLHPDEEPLTSEIFSVIVSAVLFGRVTALQRQGALPTLEAAHKHDPATSTVQAVRCLGWSAALLSMEVPAVYADAQFDGLVEVALALPPCTRLGARALSGRTTFELAFLAGRHLAYFREEHFIRTLVPTVFDLEDLFLAALLIGTPAMALDGGRRERVAPLVAAIEPFLPSAARDRLRACFLRFVDEGGRTNLQRWSSAADFTAARAGFLLCNDLVTAQTMLQLEDATAATERMNDLLWFAVSDRYATLRQRLGVAQVETK